MRPVRLTSICWRRKAAGLRIRWQRWGEQFSNIIDVTLAYPDNTDKPFRDMLMGRMHRIVVRIRVLPVDEQVRGDYFHDKPYKRQFQQWLTALWQRKDQQLATLYQSKSDV